MLSRLLAWLDSTPTHSEVDPYAFHMLAKQDPGAAKRWLKEEHRALVDEWTRLQNATDERLGIFAERLKNTTPQTLEHHFAMLMQQREELLRLIERVQLSDIPTAALQEEWGDWLRYQHEAHHLPERAKQRFNAIKAELALRGVRLSEGDVRSKASHEPVRPVDVPTSNEPPIQAQAFIPADQDQLVAIDEEGFAAPTDQLDEWQHLEQLAAQAVDSWNQQYRLLLDHPEAFTPEQATDLIHQYRSVHRRLKEQDRSQNQRRWRLAHVMGR